MTPANAIALAKEAGINPSDDFTWVSRDQLAIFASLVEARVREECAKVADERAQSRERLYKENGAFINAAKSIEAEEIAAAIRSTDDGG